MKLIFITVSFYELVPKLLSHYVVLPADITWNCHILDPWMSSRCLLKDGFVALCMESYTVTHQQNSIICNLNLTVVSIMYLFTYFEKMSSFVKNRQEFYCTTSFKRNLKHTEFLLIHIVTILCWIQHLETSYGALEIIILTLNVLKRWRNPKTENVGITRSRLISINSRVRNYISIRCFNSF